MQEGSPVQTIARCISVIGHPAVLVPGAIALRSVGQSPQVQITQLTAGVSFVIIAGVMLYSWLQVRKGNWSHIDASDKSERHQLNLLLIVLLFGAGLGSAWLGLPELLTLGLGMTGAMIALIWLAQRWLKISLHTSFAMLASLLLWPIWPLVLSGMLVTIAVGWSRLVLSRHSIAEVMTGALIGALTGGLFVQFANSPIFS